MLTCLTPHWLCWPGTDELKTGGEKLTGCLKCVVRVHAGTHVQDQHACKAPPARPAVLCRVEGLSAGLEPWLEPGLEPWLELLPGAQSRPLFVCLKGAPWLVQSAHWGCEGGRLSYRYSRSLAWPCPAVHSLSPVQKNT